MRSGTAFSAIFLIWIIALVAAFYMLYPDIEKSINSVNNIDFTATQELLQEASGSKDIKPVDYSPLAVFNNLSL